MYDIIIKKLSIITKEVQTIMTESEVRSKLMEYYGTKGTPEDINRFIRNTKAYSRQKVVGNKQDSKYPNGVILTVTTNKSLEQDFNFIPDTFGTEDVVRESLRLRDIFSR